MLVRVVELMVTRPLWLVSTTGAVVWWTAHFVTRPWLLLQ